MRSEHVDTLGKKAERFYVRYTTEIILQYDIRKEKHRLYDVKKQLLFLSTG